MPPRLKHQLDGETPVGMNHFGFHNEDTAATSEVWWRPALRNRPNASPAAPDGPRTGGSTPAKSSRNRPDQISRPAG